MGSLLSIRRLNREEVIVVNWQNAPVLLIVVENQYGVILVITALYSYVNTTIAHHILVKK